VWFRCGGFLAPTVTSSINAGWLHSAYQSGIGRIFFHKEFYAAAGPKISGGAGSCMPAVVFQHLADVNRFTTRPA
jgi:hypothetical protein